MNGILSPRSRQPTRNWWRWQRFNAGAVDQLWYYRSLANVLGARHPGVLTDELRAVVHDMETLAGWWFDVGDPQEPKRAR